MYLIYQVIITLGLLVASPYLFVKALIGGHGIKERFGNWKFQPDNRPVVWFHAASMGELKIIVTLLPEFGKLAGEYRIIITTVTKTGKSLAQKSLPDCETFYLPLDLDWIVKKAIRTVKPSLLVCADKWHQKTITRSLSLEMKTPRPKGIWTCCSEERSTSN